MTIKTYNHSPLARRVVFLSIRAKIVSLVLVLAACGTQPCFAHHGVAPHYDASKPVTVEGVVTRFDFINPHSFVYIEMRDEQGAAQTWKCELDGRATLARSGRGADLFVVGQQVTLQGIAARRDPTGCAFRTGCVQRRARAAECRGKRAHRAQGAGFACGCNVGGRRVDVETSRCAAL